MKKPGLTIDDHKQLGMELALMRDRLVKIEVLLGNKYPKTGKLHLTAIRARYQVDVLRGLLENAMYRETPELTYEDQDAKKFIYYPIRAELP